ncbi:MAG TPA: gamma-glutamyl-gamma-aminobutyrate hydrolase family protein [Candidatus Corynebacterium avicola]|uniref:Gamma-glutamyl-gamma-aminobutyrate hydrolase family protein n=1 Tax=Candidatus Corynebacterium avicola TaxID=2838527 RepID=A0A9D1RPA9_9CORY|nr:gamma-glutamyl-gamma-aminobutyrate hydrolase family protein [Candidatus Corynebacterium avicola]
MTFRVAVHHPTDHRPHDPAFQALITELNEQVRITVEALGWTPVFIAGDATDTTDPADPADLIVIVGGEDVDPSFYDGPTSYPGAGHRVPSADAAHIEVVRTAVANRTPLLGICRGLQIINVALGGTLVQDMDGHRHHGDDPFVGTRVDGPWGDDPVLCTHHQAIDRLAGGLQVVARAEDGVVEAVVHHDAPVTGVQWHPEHPEVASTQLTALLLRLEAQYRAVVPTQPVAG